MAVIVAGIAAIVTSNQTKKHDASVRFSLARYWHHAFLMAYLFFLAVMYNTGMIIKVVPAISGSWKTTFKRSTENTMEAKGSVALRMLASWGKIYFVLVTYAQNAAAVPNTHIYMRLRIAAVSKESG